MLDQNPMDGSVLVTVQWKTLLLSNRISLHIHPLRPVTNLIKDQRVFQLRKIKYQRLAGKLIYLSHSRPNITYTMSMVSQFMHNRKEVHIEMVT